MKLTTLSLLLKRIVSLFGRVSSWLVGVLILVISLDVGLRYLLSYSTPALFELEWHLFGMIFLLGLGDTLKNKGHVQIDILSSRFSEHTRNGIHVAGTLIFLIPFCALGFIYGCRFTLHSLELMESSADPGGLPARFIIKGMIPLGFLILFLQGISDLIDILFKRTETTQQE